MLVVCIVQATSAMYHKILDECLTRYGPSVFSYIR
jgi:hypothetical protein